MSFQPPAITPNFDTNREQEDAHWRQKKHVVDGRPASPGKSKITSSYAFPRSQNTSYPQMNSYPESSSSSLPDARAIKDKIGGFLGVGTERDLPMYKDKPHFPGGRRNKFVDAAFPRGRRQRWAILGVVLFVVLWWSGLFSRSTIPRNDQTLEVSKQKTGLWAWLNHKEVDWDVRRRIVKQVFATSWDDYAKHAWGKDEYSPISKKGKFMVKPQGSSEQGKNGLGWIIVDALDTAIMMDLPTQVAQAREWIKTSLDFSQLEGDVSTFETTIRVLGGLLSAHYLSNAFPELAAQKDDDRGAKGEDLYIEKAADLADRLLGAFETASGVPFASVNLNTSEGIPSNDIGGASSTAEATTLQLEMKYVAKLTGESLYWEKAEKVMKVIDANKVEGGLVPIYINPTSGKFQGNNIRLGSRGDSYYEYLIKQFLQTGKRETVYNEMWEETVEGMKKHLISFSKHGNFTVLGERQNGLGGELSGKMDHLVCFLPGTIALGVTHGDTVAEAKRRMGSDWGWKQEEDLILAEELMKTCWGMYAVTPTGLAPEITYMVLDDEPRRWVSHEEDPKWKQPRSIVSFENDDENAKALHSWRDDYDIQLNDRHNLQRPETAESLFYMYRITGDEKYRHWGWEMLRSFQQHTQVYDGHGKVRAYTSIDNVMKVQDRKSSDSSASGVTNLVGGHAVHTGRDNMEGFWLAETLKYLYLLFSDETDDWSDIRKVVINTEAHFFPRFDIAGSKAFKTGWSRTQEEEDAGNAEAISVEDAAALLAAEINEHAKHIIPGG